jgi:hypothetical protein
MPSERFGYLGGSVALADFDDDGTLDLVIGATGVNVDGRNDCGKVYVIYNAAALPETVSVGTSECRVTHIVGSGAKTWWGNPIIATDLNGDGIDDIGIRGNSRNLWTETRDTVAFFFGARNPPDTLMIESDTTCFKFVSVFHDENLGRAMIAADFNADGAIDVAFGADGYDGFRGRVLLVFSEPDTTASDDPVTPPDILLYQNQPNPFSAITELSFTIPVEGETSLTVYDVLGREVTTLLTNQLPKGRHSVLWDGTDDRGTRVSAGVYFVRLESRAGSGTKKLMILR